uniref:Uncharacterized protein n=1 Tax=Anguilla anguilla TaxID=7936 RepID=A0A0E9QL86_ANGAN
MKKMYHVSFLFWFVGKFFFVKLIGFFYFATL